MGTVMYPMMCVMAITNVSLLFSLHYRETNPNNWHLLPFRDQSEKLVKLFTFSNILLIIMPNFISDSLFFFFSNEWNKSCL